MLSWLRSRRDRAERIDAKASALIRAFGVDAYSEARRKEHQADSAGTAREWSLVALAVARKTGKRIGLDTSTRMAINAVFAPDREPAAAREHRPYSELRPVDELTRIVGPKLKPFRIQFVGAAPDGGKSVSKEVEIRASDRSAAIVAAANLVVWPPETIGLRILDGAGREVIGRPIGERATDSAHSSPRGRQRRASASMLRAG